METILHILTRKDDSLADAMLGEQEKKSQTKLQTFDLTAAQPNYDKLIEEIFKADAVHVW